MSAAWTSSPERSDRSVSNSCPNFLHSCACERDPHVSNQNMQWSRIRAGTPYHGSRLEYSHNSEKSQPCPPPLDSRTHRTEQLRRRPVPRYDEDQPSINKLLLDQLPSRIDMFAGPSYFVNLVLFVRWGWTRSCWRCSALLGLRILWELPPSATSKCLGLVTNICWLDGRLLWQTNLQPSHKSDFFSPSLSKNGKIYPNIITGPPEHRNYPPCETTPTTSLCGIRTTYNNLPRSPLMKLWLADRRARDMLCLSTHDL